MASPVARSQTTVVSRWLVRPMAAIRSGPSRASASASPTVASPTGGSPPGRARPSPVADRWAGPRPAPGQRGGAGRRTRRPGCWSSPGRSPASGRVRRDHGWAFLRLRYGPDSGGRRRRSRGRRDQAVYRAAGGGTGFLVRNFDDLFASPGCVLAGLFSQGLLPMSPILIPLTALLIPIVIVPTSLWFRHRLRVREMEHVERIRAMELGIAPAKPPSAGPGRRSASGSARGSRSGRCSSPGWPC